MRRPWWTTVNAMPLNPGVLASIVLVCVSSGPRLAPASTPPTPIEHSHGLHLRTHGVRPLAGAVLRGFAPPAERWLAGHRGIDIQGREGDTVVAVADGTIHFAGQVGGTDVVSIAHDSGLISTYQPVSTDSHTGDSVTAGEPIGLLEDSNHCLNQACLHFGAKRGTNYVNPFTTFGLWPILLPLGRVGF